MWSCTCDYSGTWHPRRPAICAHHVRFTRTAKASASWQTSSALTVQLLSFQVRFWFAWIPLGLPRLHGRYTCKGARDARTISCRRLYEILCACQTSANGAQWPSWDQVAERTAVMI